MDNEGVERMRGDGMEDGRGPYDYQYEGYHKDRTNAEGYDFQSMPSGSVPVPHVTFAQRLKWWTLDRWKRRKSIRAERDRRLQEILDVKKQSRA